MNKDEDPGTRPLYTGLCVQTRNRFRSPKWADTSRHKDPIIYSSPYMFGEALVCVCVCVHYDEDPKDELPW